jgi:uncharacterized protein YecE (DUF72 family)
VAQETKKMAIVIGCSGFSVPASRYFKEFTFVEITETHVSTPGVGTIKRWRREAPQSFDFALIAPREIGQEGFRAGKVTDTALASLVSVAKELSAKTAVFVAPSEVTASKPVKTAVAELLARAKKKFARVIWDAPHWDPDDAESVAEGGGALAARDPLAHGLSSQKVAYYRLPGPAGHKSRYEDPSITKLAELAGAAKHTQATYVFTNVDMTQDAKRLKRALNLE